MLPSNSPKTWKETSDLCNCKQRFLYQILSYIFLLYQILISYKYLFHCMIFFKIIQCDFLGLFFRFCLSSTTTSVQHPLGWCDGCHRTTAPVCSPHTSYRWRGERVIEPIKWMGIIRTPWLTRASGGNLARTPGLYSFPLREVPWDF